MRFTRTALQRFLSGVPLLILAACGSLPPPPEATVLPEPPAAPELPARQTALPEPPAPQPVEPIDTRNAGESAPRRRPDAQVRFMPESDRIDPASQQALAEVAQRWARNKSQWIILRAQPTAGGSREYSQARALRDCYAVEARLGEMGVPERRVRAQAHSQRTPEAGERRVDVYLESSRSD